MIFYNLGARTRLKQKAFAMKENTFGSRNNMDRHAWGDTFDPILLIFYGRSLS